jgi:hypothetical protein
MLAGFFDKGRAAGTMAQPTEDMLRVAVDEAMVCAESEGHTEAKANTEFCVQFLVDRFPGLGRAGALDAFMRLCFEKQTGLPDSGTWSPLPEPEDIEVDLPSRPAETRQRRSARDRTRLPLGERGEPLPVWSQPVHGLGLNRRSRRRGR